MILTLTRDQYLPECTLGVLLAGPRKLFTIERPWIPNSAAGKSGEKYVSCIGEGTYRLRPHMKASGERVWILSNPMMDVYELPSDVPPGRELATRTLVMIHAANYVHDVIGCIGPGVDRVKNANEWMVTQSRDAMNQLHTVMDQTLDLSLIIQKNGGTA